MHILIVLKNSVPHQGQDSVSGASLVSFGQGVSSYTAHPKVLYKTSVSSGYREFASVQASSGTPL